MSKAKRKRNELKKRVREAPIPTERIHRPKNGRWVTMERRARAEMKRAHKESGITC